MVYAVVGSLVLLSWGFAAVNLAKGKPWFALFAFLLGALGHVVGPVGAIRLAKPDSWWARRYYGEEKLGVAHARHPTYEDRTQAQEQATAIRAPAASTEREELARSRKLADTPGEWRCRVCGLEFDDWDDGIAHYETIHPGGPASSTNEKHPGRVFVAGLQALERVG